MSTYSDETYGERIADVYDDLFSEYEPEAIDLLAGLAGDGPALELGIGTGRFALPLLAKGVEVHGVDASPSMIARLRSKPNGDRISVVQASFADAPLPGQFGLVYVVFNTFFAQTTQEEQVRCFRNVAAHLKPEGCFVIEAFVPDLTRFNHAQVNWTSKVTTDRVEFDAGRHDALTQQVMSQKVVITDGNIRLYPVQIRYAWPSELDLMAQLAGLRLRERWSSWRREPFTAESQKHISIYEHVTQR